MSLTELPEVRFRTEISVFLTVLRFGLRFEPNLRFGKNIIINIKFQLKSFNKTLNFNKKISQKLPDYFTYFGYFGEVSVLLAVVTVVSLRGSRHSLGLCRLFQLHFQLGILRPVQEAIRFTLSICCVAWD